MGQAVADTVRCQHLGKGCGVRETSFGRETEFLCGHRRHQKTTAAACVTCREFLARETRPSAVAVNVDSGDCPHPSGVICDRYDRETNIADLYKGASAFLLLGGPSSKDLPLELLSRRGVLLLSTNNCPGVLPKGIRPHVWLHTDKSLKFHESIWRDPGVLKIVPVKEWKLGRGGKKALRQRNADGVLRQVPGMAAKDMPGVLGFERNTKFCPETWLFEDRINRGNDKESATGMKKGKKVAEPNGYPHTINTMFAAVRLAFYLGIKKLYLIGADFVMRDDSPYGFGQDKSPRGVKSNNNAYANMNAMFDSLLPRFEEAEYEVINCTPDSGLWSFPYLPFKEAIAEVTDSFEQELNCNGWYDEEDKKVEKTEEVEKNE